MTDAAARVLVEDLTTYFQSEEAARGFAEAETSSQLTDGLRRDLARRGLFGLCVPTAYGGAAIDLRTRAALYHLLGSLSASLQSIVTAHEMAVHAVSSHTDSAVARRWLELMATGERLGAFALTEPGGGSSLGQIRTTVKSYGGRSLLEGMKVLVSGALHAGVCLTIVRADSGVRAMLVDCEEPQLSIAPSPPLAAFRGAALGDLTFTQCAGVPIGRDGLSGLRLVTSCLTLGRIFVAASALGVGAAALDELVEHACQREIGRGLLADMPLAQAVAADCYLSLQSGIALLDTAIQAFDTHAPSAIRDAITAKLVAARAVRQTTSCAIRLHGAAGLRAGSSLQRHAAEAQVFDVIEGSDETLASILGADIMRTGTNFFAGRADVT